MFQEKNTKIIIYYRSFLIFDFNAVITIDLNVVIYHRL